MNKYKWDTLGELIQSTGDKQNKLRIVRYEKPDLEMTYWQFRQKALETGAWLKAQKIEPGDKVLLICADLYDFLMGFWGCVSIGAIVVPLNPQHSADFNPEKEFTIQIKEICRQTNPKLILTGAEEMRKKPEAFLPDLNWITMNQLKSKASLPDVSDKSFLKLERKKTDVAIIMFTSGSTGRPKGVPLTHQNILAGVYSNNLACKSEKNRNYLNWLPLEHVAALVMHHIRQMSVEANQIQVETEVVLKDIYKWLDLISQHKINETWAPNFAFQQLLTKQTLIKSSSLDLSALDTIHNAGEPIDYEICNKCMKMLEAKGLRRSALKPCWGMTEASTGILFSENFGKIRMENTVACGCPVPGIEVRFVDENGEKINENGKEGHFQIRGESVFSGYLYEDKKNTFTEDGWFDTGDLGLMLLNEVLITGRTKDVYIRNGVKYGFAEIEACVETAIEELQEQELFLSIAVERSKTSGVEELCLFLRDEMRCNKKDLAEKIKEKLAQRFAFTYQRLYAIPDEEIPRTNIGKVDKKGLLKLEHLERFQITADEVATRSLEETPLIYEKMAELWKQVLHLDQLSVTQDYFSLGGTSLQIPELIKTINDQFGCRLTVADLFRCSSVCKLSDAITAEEEDYREKENVIVL